MARTVADTLVLAVLAIVVMLSRKWGSIVVILLGLAATVASFLPTGEWSPVSRTIARHGGAILAFSALVWVVRGRAAPDRGANSLLPAIAWNGRPALTRLVGCTDLGTRIQGRVI